MLYFSASNDSFYNVGRAARFLIITFFLLLTSGVANAKIRFPFYVIGNYSTFQTNLGSVQPTAAFGGGTGVELQLLNKIGLEADLLLIQRKALFNARYIQLPIMLRYYILNAIFFGGGYYYAHGLPTIQDLAGSKSISFSKAGLKNDDKGYLLLVGFQLPFPISPLIELRYSVGQRDVSAVSQVSANYRDAQLLIGLKL